MSYHFLFNNDLTGGISEEKQKKLVFLFCFSSEMYYLCHRKSALCALVRCFDAVPYW